MRNDRRDGFHQHLVHEPRTSYAPNPISGGCPAAMDGYRHYQEKAEGSKMRRRSPSFENHYSQATLFWNSMSGWEKEHILSAFLFELGRVERKHIEEGAVAHLGKIHLDVARRWPKGLGLPEPAMPA